MSEPTTPDLVELIVLAAAGLGEFDRFGPRGVTLVSRDEIEAMAVLLACLGLTPIRPGITKTEGEALGHALADFFNINFSEA